MGDRHCIVDDLDTVYADSGSGPVVLFLHGWGTGATSFDTLIAQMSDSRQCIALSLPGFGGSERPREAWGVLAYAQFVSHFLTKLGREPDAIVAHSFGGRIALKGIGAGVLCPRRLVLIASAGAAKRLLYVRALRGIATCTRIFVAIAPFSLLRKRLQRLVGSRDYVRAGVMRETFVKVVDEPLEEDAGRVTTPTLLVWGEHDTETPLSEAETLHERIHGSRLVVIPGAGHFVFQEQPGTVAEHLRDFLC